MINIFKIKNNRKINTNDIFNKYQKISKLDNDNILKNYNSNIEGLTNKEANKRLEENGLNIVVKNENKSWFYFLFTSFKDEFILILLFLAIVNFCLGDKLGSFVIVIIACISALIRFFQDYGTYKFNKKLKSKLYSSAIVYRDNKEIKIKTDNVVIGDIIKLNAGVIIPADAIIIENKDLFINQSVFTGESVPVEKSNTYKEADSIFEINNIAFMGSDVISGSGTAVVISTSFDTYLGMMGKELGTKKVENNFEVGMNNITKLLIRYMLFVCLFVLIVDGIIKHNLNEALLFALSVAVGITPSMLPMIVNVNLTKGTKSLAKKKTLVKEINAIQNLGAIDVLCTDKTGTLTENKIVLQKYINIDGKEDNEITKYAFLNSYYGTGMKNLVDRAVITYAKENSILVDNYEKIDELPFDYIRRKMSVVVKNEKKEIMITKGALEVIINSCSNVKYKNEIIKFTEAHKNQAREISDNLAKTGMQVIAIAYKNEYPGINKFNSKDEEDMIFLGIIGFLDPPKKGVKTIINNLKNIGISTKILTGDNYYATENICNMVGIDNVKILTGVDLNKMTDLKLSKEIENVNVYARLNPLQKERIVRLLKDNGHVVGFMGDGVNDAPALSTADVGISVNTASDIAKEASHIILLERSLNVIYDGVVEGRKVYANIIKYMKMALSADFGDVFSIMIASIFLPFLPLLPIQMLFQDFIYDFSQIGIPYDNVDPEFLEKPRKWNTSGLSKFMKIMGITSSIIDVLSFIVFWFILGYNNPDKQTYFQTAWFVTCLITELMIILNVRTAKRPFIDSNASKELTILTLLSGGLTIITPILLCNVKTFNFVVLPAQYYIFLVILVLLYFIIVTVIKKIYIKKYKEWL